MGLPFLLTFQTEEEVVNIHADQVINFLQLASQQDEVGENKYELSLLTATAGGSAPTQKDTDKMNTQLNKVYSRHTVDSWSQSVMIRGVATF